MIDQTWTRLFVVVLLVFFASANAQTPDSAEDATNVVQTEKSCGGKAATVRCAHKRLVETGFAWLIPTILLVGVGSWVWSFVSSRAGKPNDQK